MMNNFISRKEAANRCSVKEKTIDRWVRQGRIKAFKPDRSSRVLIYADTLTQENLQSVEPKFKNKL